MGAQTKIQISSLRDIPEARNLLPGRNNPSCSGLADLEECVLTWVERRRPNTGRDMVLRKNVLPLIALEAVALDTETTGLDPRKASIVEIGAARIVRGQLDPDAVFQQLVRPGAPIPAAAVDIHQIDDSAVASAPPFADVWPRLSDYLGDLVLIGHTIGFDLALLTYECERIGVALRTPVALDIRLLAEVAEPNLAGYSLDHLAAWLEIRFRAATRRLPMRSRRAGSSARSRPACGNAELGRLAKQYTLARCCVNIRMRRSRRSGLLQQRCRAPSRHRLIRAPMCCPIATEWRQS